MPTRTIPQETLVEPSQLLATLATNPSDLLTAAQEKQLARLMRQGGEIGEGARTRFIEANLRLVSKMAQRYDRSGMEYDDLVQEGRIGLIRAVDKFDPERGYKFSTMATWWIKQAITRALDEQSTAHVPVYQQERRRRVRRVEQRLQQDLGRTPTDAEVADAAELTMTQLAAVRELDDVLEMRSLDQASYATLEELPLGTLLADPGEDTEAQAVANASSAALLDSLQELLDPRECWVLKLRYGFDGREHTLEEVGKKLDVTRERIRQIEQRALAKLRRSSMTRRLQPVERSGQTVWPKGEHDVS